MTGQTEVLFRLIPLSQGQYAVVSPSDYEWLMQWKWYARWVNSTQSFRAIRSAGKVDGKRVFLYMSRAIMGLDAQDECRVDHVNRNTLDNRRINLRVCSGSENMRNRGLQKNNRSGFKGVHKIKEGYYQARIMVDKRFIHLGCASTPEAASVLYQEGAKKYHGTFACLK